LGQIVAVLLVASLPSDACSLEKASALFRASLTVQRPPDVSKFAIIRQTNRFITATASVDVRYDGLRQEMTGNDRKNISAKFGGSTNKIP
jgi:hypothetical protein